MVSYEYVSVNKFTDHVFRNNIRIVIIDSQIINSSATDSEKKNSDSTHDIITEFWGKKTIKIVVISDDTYMKQSDTEHTKYITQYGLKTLVYTINYSSKNNIKEVSEHYLEKQNYTYDEHDFKMAYQPTEGKEINLRYTHVGLRLVEMKFSASPDEIIYITRDIFAFTYCCFAAQFMGGTKNSIYCSVPKRIIHNLTNYLRHGYTSYFNFYDNCIVVEGDGGEMQLKFAEHLQQCGKKFIIIICESRGKYKIHKKSD